MGVWPNKSMYCVFPNPFLLHVAVDKGSGYVWLLIHMVACEDNNYNTCVIIFDCIFLIDTNRVSLEIWRTPHTVQL